MKNLEKNHSHNVYEQKKIEYGNNLIWLINSKEKRERKKQTEKRSKRKEN